MSYILPFHTVHGVLQARILEWVAFPFSRGSSQHRDRTQVSRVAGGFFTSWAIREAISSSDHLSSVKPVTALLCLGTPAGTSAASSRNHQHKSTKTLKTWRWWDTKRILVSSLGVEMRRQSISLWRQLGMSPSEGSNFHHFACVREGQQKSPEYWFGGKHVLESRWISKWSIYK